MKQKCLIFSTRFFFQKNLFKRVNALQEFREAHQSIGNLTPIILEKGQKREITLSS